MKVQVQLQHVHPVLAEDAESSAGDMPGQHRDDTILRDAARGRHMANLQHGIGRADVWVESGVGCGQHVRRDRLAGQFGLGFITAIGLA
jgi:hypothetical protein